MLATQNNKAGAACLKSDKQIDTRAELAKENQRGGQGGVLLPQNSAKANIDTRAELAKVAGVSHKAKPPI